MIQGLGLRAMGFGMWELEFRVWVFGLSGKLGPPKNTILPVKAEGTGFFLGYLIQDTILRKPYYLL